jgi:TetR/AcrR family transcriptional repressor of bet genes
VTTSHEPPLPDPRSRPIASTTRSRTAGRPRAPAASRDQITNAVVDLICERGLQGWSMRDLAARLNLSTGTITHHFRDKQALLIAAMDAVYVLPADWPRYRSLPPIKQLQRISDMFVLDDRRKRRWGRFWLAYLAGASHDPALRSHQEERSHRQRRFFARLIAAAIDARQFASTLDADEEAARLVALGTGLSVLQIATPDGLLPATARSILDAHLTALQTDVDSPAAEE